MGNTPESRIIPKAEVYRFYPMVNSKVNLDLKRMCVFSQNSHFGRIYILLKILILAENSVVKSDLKTAISSKWKELASSSNVVQHRPFHIKEKAFQSYGIPDSSSILSDHPPLPRISPFQWKRSTKSFVNWATIQSQKAQATLHAQHRDLIASYAMTKLHNSHSLGLSYVINISTIGCYIAPNNPALWSWRKIRIPVILRLLKWPVFLVFWWSGELPYVFLSRYIYIKPCQYSSNQVVLM